MRHKQNGDAIIDQISMESIAANVAESYDLDMGQRKLDADKRRAQAIKDNYVQVANASFGMYECLTCYSVVYIASKNWHYEWHEKSKQDPWQLLR